MFWSPKKPLVGNQQPGGDPPELTGEMSRDRWELYSRETSVKPLTTFVYHETAGPPDVSRLVNNSISKCEAGKCYGVGFSIGPKGQPRQHTPLSRRENHSGIVNDYSKGVEVTNIWDSREGQPSEGQEVVDAPWTWGMKRVIMPSPAQMEAGWELLDWLRKTDEGSGIVMEWPGVVEKDGELRYYWSQIPGVKAGVTGVVAHSHIPGKHNDGLASTLYSWFRFHGYSPEEAYQATKDASAKATLEGGTTWSSPIPPPKSSGFWWKVGAGAGVVAVAVVAATQIPLVKKTARGIWRAIKRMM